MIVNKGLAMAQVLDELSSATLELDASMESEDIRYTEEDVMNALQIAMHVWQNAQIHNGFDKEGITNMKDWSKRNLGVWKRLSALVYEITGVNSRTYYKEKSKRKH